MPITKESGRRQLVDSKAAAEYLGLPRDSGEQQLNRCRCEGLGAFADLPYFKIGRRVRYDLAEIDRWLNARRRGGAAA